MVITNMVSKYAGLYCIIAVTVIAGCFRNSYAEYTGQIGAGNRSTNDIRFVVISSEGTTNEFGFLDSEVGHKTTLSCQFRFFKFTVISWEEDGAKRNATIDTANYGSRHAAIKSLGFTYIGNGKWEVVARSGTNEDSPIIKPTE